MYAFYKETHIMFRFNSWFTYTL